MPQVEPERCPSCMKSLSYRDNDNPLLNCVALCENTGCSDPFREEYYEEPAGAEEFRKTDEWEECYMDSATEDKTGRVYVTTRTEDNIKRADALYLKRLRPM